MNDRQSKEWLFEFGLYSQDGLPEISEAACRELMDLIIDWAEAKKLNIGGGYRPGEDEKIILRKT